MLLHYLAMNLSHLLHPQFTRQHHHIGKLGIKLQGFDVRDVQLGRQMHLDTHLPAILHHRHIRGDDGCDASLAGGIYYLVHQGNVLAIDNGIHRQVRLHPSITTLCRNVAQVVQRKVVGRVRAHVQLLHSEVDAPRPGLQCRSQ